MKTSGENINMIQIPVAEYEALKERNERLANQVERLSQQLKAMQRARFGRSSEKTQLDESGIQLDMFGNSALAEKKAPETEVTVKEHKRKKKRPVADRFPPGLAVKEVLHGFDLHPVCSVCGHEMRIIGKEQVGPDMFDLELPKVHKVRNLYAVWGCGYCEKEGIQTPIVKSPVDPPLVKRGYLTGNTNANTAVKKFLLGQPLYRQQQEWSWLGVILSRQTMSNNLIQICDTWLKPIYDEMKRQLLTHTVLHADETSMKALHVKDRKGPVKGQYWQYRTSWDSPHAIIVYEFTPGRGKVHPQTFLADWEGYLHTDGYKAYPYLKKAIIVLGCWAHLRRYFYEGYMSITNEAARKGTEVEKGLAYCNTLFMIEREIADLPANVRYAVRLERSKPIVDAFFAWIRAINPSGNSPVYNGVKYARSQQESLKVFLQDGRLEISNNRAERSFRTLVITRKNYLFSNTQHGAEVNAVYYTLLQTAKENGLNPFEYLQRVFRDAPKGIPVSQLLPWN